MSAKNPSIGSVGNIKSGVERAGQKAAYSPLMEALTRLGYGVRGLIYITMGLLAFNVAIGKGGAITGQQGAIAVIGKQPAGMILLWLVLIGLVSYSIWGVVRAVLDPLNKGHDLKGTLTRIGYLFSAASYAILIVPTYGYISGATSTSQNGAQSPLSLATVMSTPLGHLAIGLVGLVVLGVGLYQVYQGFKSTFDKQFKTYAMNATELKWTIQLGRIGTATRGFIMAVLGVLLILAALQSNSGQAIGLDAALSALLKQPYGVWLLAITALGLMAFGTYSILNALWFRLQKQAKG